MADLKEDSKLYEKLANIYDENKDHITLEIFKKCVNIAKETERVEIKYVLFKLKCLYDDQDLGIEKANMISKIIKNIAGDNFRASFVINVLETALEEM